MIPKTTGRQIQLFVVDSIYKTQTKTMKDESGNKEKYERQKFVKEAFLKTWFYKSDISPYGEYVGTKGQVVKSRCIVYDRSSSKAYVVGHSVDEVHKALNENSEVGFKK